jgi:hypothetical protein
MKKDKKKKQKKQRPSGACALCHQTAQLHDSHIISEFLYKELYDAKHTYPLVEADPRKHGGPPAQKGIREYLLCGSCEQRFSKWETYASGVFLKLIALLRGRRTQDMVEVSAEYETFRLFLLSLLWRLDATSHRIRGNVGLGDDAECIRQILLSGTAPEPDEYPCVIAGLLLDEDGTFHPELSLQALTPRPKPFQIIRIVISGMLFVYYVPTHNPPEPAPMFLGRDNVLRVRLVPERNFPDILKVRRTLGASEALRDVDRIRKHLVRNGLAAPDAPVTIQLVVREQPPEPGPS